MRVLQPIGEEDFKTLSKLGLKSTEAKVYLALVKNGPSNAREIAQNSNVARPDIYRTVSQLQNIGLVEKIVAKPQTFNAIPLSEALAILFQKREKENEELIEKTGILLKKYNTLQRNATREKANQFILIPQKETLIRERARAINNTKEKVCVMIPQKNLLQVLTNSFELLSNATQRKVCFQINTEETENKTKLKKLIGSLGKSPYFEVRERTPPPLPANFSIYDGKEMRLSTSSKSGYAEAPDIWTNNLDIIELALTSFKTKWETATPLKTQQKPTRRKEREESTIKKQTK